MGAAFHLEHAVLSGRLLSFAKLPPLGADHWADVDQGNSHRCRVHAHGMGAAGTHLRDIDPTAILGRTDGINGY